MKKYLSYRDDDLDETIIRGYFEVLEETENYIKFRTEHGRTIKLPYNRLLKIKDK